MQRQPLGLGLRQIDPHRRPAGIRATCPNQRSLRRRMELSMVGWRQQTSRMSMISRRCRRETPRIARSAYIWKVSSVMRSALVIVQVSELYSKTDTLPVCRRDVCVDQMFETGKKSFRWLDADDFITLIFLGRLLNTQPYYDGKTIERNLQIFTLRLSCMFQSHVTVV